MLINLSGKDVVGFFVYFGLGDVLIGDECKIVGFDSSNVNVLYMWFVRINIVVCLVIKDYV